MLQERLSPGKYRLTVDDYLRLDEAGVFETSRTELLDGDIIVRNAEYRPHAWMRDELWYGLRRALERANSELTAMGASVRASDHDMPLPDIVLTREPKGDGPIPLPSVALIVEIASTTLHRDMADKVRIYAHAGVPEYWVVDVAGGVVHQMWSPHAGGYSERHEIGVGEPIVAATLDGLTVDVPKP